MAPRKKNKDQSAAGTLNKMETITSLNIPPLRPPKCVAVDIISKPNAQKMEEMVQSIHELDPTTLEFTQLLKLLQPKFISDYLERILIFLQNRNREMCFSNIAPIQQVFLERLAKDPSNLKCDFEPYAKSVASKILNILQTNPHLQWTCAYDIRSNEGVMVYKKQCPAARTESNFKHPSSIPPKQLHNLNKQKENVSYMDDNYVPTSFKTQWLNTTLKFVKDDTQTTLMYPEMPRASAEFIFQMISKPELGSDSYGYKSMCAPLWEAIKILSLKYEFKVTFVSCSSVSSTSLMLQKIRKQTTKSNCSPHENDITKPIPQSKPARSLSTSSSSTTFSSRDPSPHQQRPATVAKLQRKQKIIQSLTPEFISDVLNKLAEFLENDYIASVIFQSSNSNELLFLTGLRGLVRYIKIYPNVYKSVLGRICKALAAVKLLEWKLKVNWRDINKKEGIREATYRKVPREKFAKPNKCLMDFKISETNDLKVNTKSESCKHPGQKFLEALCKNRSDDEVVSNDNSQEITNRRVENLRDSSADSRASNQSKAKEKKIVNNIEKTRDHSVSSRASNRSDSLDRRAKKQINFQSAGQLPPPADQSTATNQSKSSIDQSNITNVQSMKSIKSNALLPSISKAKQKIYEAMTTPMDSDKGMRMMKLMGWSGGALGARGEGITEPIIPAILIKSGAGLGHVPEPPKQNKSAKSTKKDLNNTNNVTISKNATFNKEKLKKAQRFQLRIVILKNLLELMNGDLCEVEIIFGTGVPEKGVNFLENALLTFNGGNKFGLNTQEEISYVEQIQREMKNTKCILTALVANKSIILSKVLPLKLASIQSTNKSSKPINSTKTPTDNFVTRMQNTRKTRLELLERILAFVASECKEKEFVLVNDSNQALKKRVMLENILDVANKKNLDCIEGQELQLFERIIGCMKEFCLSLETLNDKEHRYLLKKKYRRKFINSALNPSTNEKKRIPTSDNVTEKTDEVKLNLNKYDNDDEDLIVIDDRENESENNNNLKSKNFDEDYERKMFQKEIDSIEKRDAVGKNNDVRTENNVESRLLWSDTYNDKEINEEKNVQDADVEKSDKKHETDIKIINLGNQEQIDNINKDINSNVLTLTKTDLEIGNIDKHNEYEGKSNVGKPILDPNSDNSNINNENGTEIVCKVIEEIPKDIKNQAQDYMIYIVPKDYPTNDISSETAKEVQRVILKAIGSTQFMPLLQCHGIKNGALVYGCGDIATKLWLENNLTGLNVNILDCANLSNNKNEYVLDIKINSLIKVDVCQILLNLENFNSDLDTSKWRVTDEVQNEDCLIIVASVDEKSYSFICEHNYALYAGVDKALFRLHW